MEELFNTQLRRQQEMEEKEDKLRKIAQDAVWAEMLHNVMLARGM